MSEELLTEREQAVCDLVIKGMSNKEVAYLLNISRHTVESHKANIYKKLEVKNAAELLHFYYLK